MVWLDRGGSYVGLFEAPFLRCHLPMRRATGPRVASQGELLFEAASHSAAARAALINLSRGGLCARGALPSRLAETGPARDSVQRVALGLCDGRPPLSVSAQLAWVQAGQRLGEDAWSFGLRFVDLSEDDCARLDAVVDSAGPPKASAGDALRVRLDNGTVLRTTIDQLDERGALLGAELPWLRLDADLGVELDGEWQGARASFIGLELTGEGVARLRLGLSFTGEPRAREITLPYFTTGALRGQPAISAHAVEKKRAEQPATEPEAEAAVRPDASPSTELRASWRRPRVIAAAAAAVGALAIIVAVSLHHHASPVAGGPSPSAMPAAAIATPTVASTAPAATAAAPAKAEASKPNKAPRSRIRRKRAR